MFQYSLMPRLNVEFSKEDIRFASKNLKNDKIITKTIGKLSEIYGIDADKITLTNSGRTALYLVLKSLNLKSSSKVGIQLYTCPVVFEAIIQAGYKPHFLEIDNESYTLDIDLLKDVSKELDALIVVHTFGNPAEMDEIKKIMGDKPVIEDCAHAIYTLYRNKFVGTFSDASFFSFGAGKNISAGGGGALIINKTDNLKIPINDILHDLRGPTEEEQKRFLYHNYLKAFFYRKPWYGLFAFDLAQKFEPQFDFQSKTKFEIETYSNANIAVLYKRLDDFKTLIENQKRNVESIEENLIQCGFSTIKRPPRSSPLYFLYPLGFTNIAERDTAWIKLRKSGIDSLKFYHDTPELAKEKYSYKDTCKNSENVIETSLVLPTYYNYEKLNLSKVLK